MSLKDITNLSDVVNENKGVTKRKRLSNGTYKQYHYAKSRRQFELVFENDAEKIKLKNKLESFKAKNGLGSMKDVFDYIFSQTDSSESEYTPSKQSNCDILSNAKHRNFICDNIQISKLVEDVCIHQSHCDNTLEATSMSHSGHVVEIVWTCTRGHIIN